MRKWNSDLIVAIAAIFIGLCAFAVSIYQAQVMQEQTNILQEQQHASVWPRLLISMNNGPGLFKIIVSNEGVGPAQIRSVEVTVDGEVRKDWNDALTALTGIGTHSIKRSKMRNRILRSGDQMEVLVVLNEQQADSINANVARMGIEICYCSIYERCWRIKRQFRSGFSIPRLVERCEVNEDRQFLN